MKAADRAGVDHPRRFGSRRTLCERRLVNPVLNRVSGYRRPASGDPPHVETQMSFGSEEAKSQE